MPASCGVTLHDRFCGRENANAFGDRPIVALIQPLSCFVSRSSAETTTWGPEVLGGGGGGGTKRRNLDMTFLDRRHNGKHMQMKCHDDPVRDSDTSPRTSGATTQSGNREINGELEEEDRCRRRCSPASPVIYSTGLFARLSLLCVLGGGRRDRFTWAGFFEVKMQTCSPL